MDRSEFEQDPEKAWRRGRALDRMLASARASGTRGVIRATHAELNQLDDARALEIARRLNSPRADPRR